MTLLPPVLTGCTDLLALDLRGLGSLAPYGADDTPAIPLV